MNILGIELITALGLFPFSTVILMEAAEMNYVLTRYSKSASSPKPQLSFRSRITDSVLNLHDISPPEVAATANSNLDPNNLLTRKLQIE